MQEMRREQVHVGDSAAFRAGGKVPEVFGDVSAVSEELF